MIELPQDEVNTNKLPEENAPQIENDQNINISSLSIPSTETLNKEMTKECRMNQNVINPKKEVSYLCKNCPDKMEILCKFCISNCHKKHHNSVKIDQFRHILVNFDQTPCQCALHNHKVKPSNKMLQKEDSSLNKDNKTYCPLNSFFSVAKPKYIYQRKDDGKYYCMYCIYNYQKIDETIKREDSAVKEMFQKRGSMYGSVLGSIIGVVNQKEEEAVATVEQFSNDLEFYSTYQKTAADYHSGSIPSCSCSNKNHKHETLSDNINGLNLFFSNEEYTTKLNMIKISYNIISDYEFIKGNMSEFTYIMDILMDEINELENKKKEVLDSNPNIEQNAVQNSEPNFQTYSSEASNPNFQKINLEDKMDWDSFNEITELFDFFACNIKTISFLDIKMFDEKLQSFFSFETLDKLLSLKSNMPLNLFKIQMFCVKMYRRFNLNVFIKNEIFENENYSALHRIIFKYQTKKKVEKEGMIIVDKIFTLCHVMEESSQIPQRLFNQMFTEALKIIKKLLPLFAFDIDSMKMLHQKIQDNIGAVKEKKDGQIQVLLSLEKITVMICTYINDYYFYENILKAKKSDNEEEKEEEKKEEDNEPEFAFMNTEFNMNLLKTLYNLDKLSSNDNLQYILSKNIYDNLINEHDYYIESIENIVNSNCEIKNQKVAKEFIQLITNDKSLNTKEITDKLDGLFKGVKGEFERMLHNELTEEDYLNKFNTFLTELNNCINNTLLVSNELTPFTSQFLFVRGGYIKQLINLIIIAQRIIRYLSNIEEEGTSEKEFVNDINEGIHESFKSILNSISKDNPFVATLFFSLSWIKVIMNDNFDNLDFYVGLTKMIKKYKYKIFPEYLLNYIINHFLGNILTELKTNITKIEKVLKLFKNLLQISSNKCIMHINNLIATQLKSILENDEFKKALATLKDETESKLIILVLKCVNFLQKEYFYIMNPYIEILPIMEKLNQIDISPNLRKILTKTYSNYFIESYFSLVNIKKYFSEENFVGVNLIDNADKRPTEKALQKFLTSDGSKNSKIFAPIIYNLENFKYFYSTNQNTFNKGLKFFLSYFEEVIFLPCVYSVYKIAYFAPNLTAQVKYNVYQIVYLFLECFKFILEQIESFNMQEKVNIEAVEKYFNTTNITRLAKIVNNSVDSLNEKKVNLLNVKNIMKIFLDNIIHFNTYQNKFNDDGDEFAAGEDEDKDNKDNKDEDVLSKINSIAEGDDNKDENSNKSSELIDKINEEIEKYNELKGNYEENNIFNELYQQEDEETIQYIITRDLIYRLNFTKTEQLVDNEINNEFMKGMKIDFLKKLNLDVQARKESSIIIRKERRTQIDISRKDINMKVLKKNKAYLGEYYKPLVNTYLETKTSVLESVCKVFKTNPSLWQDTVVSQVEITKNVINIFIKKQLPFLIQFIFVEFNRIDSKETPYYQIFVNMLEFLRLLCEDHNPIFQTLLINYEKAIKDIEDGVEPESDSEDIDLKSKSKEHVSQFITLIYRIPILILENIQHSKNTYDLLNCIKRYDWDYFSPLVQEVTDFLIEIIQGTYPKNFNDLTSALNVYGHNGFTEYYKKHFKFLDNLDKANEYDVIMSEFIRYMNCFIEENSNPMKIKLPVILKLNPKKLISVALNSFKKLILKYVSNTVKLDSHKELLNKYKNEDSDLVEDPLFNIATGIFVYLKRVNSYKEKAIGDKIFQILEAMRELKDDPTVNQENSVNLIRKEYYTFCSTLIKVNEISFTEDKQRDEKEIYRYRNFFSKKFKEEVLDYRNNHSSKKTKFDNVFFMEHPDSLYLENLDINTFLEKASYDNFNVKLNCILQYYPSLSRIIEMKKMFNGNAILKLLFQLPYSKLEIANALLSMITNILLIFSERGNIFHKLIFPYALTHIILLILLVLNWYTFNVINYIKWIEKDVTFYKLVKFVGNSMFNMEIFCFIWALFWGILAITHEKLHFLFSLQLFVIFNLFQTMQSVLLTLKARYDQFLSTAFLLVILILFYSGITFYFFKHNDDGSLLCNSYLECFLYLFNSGIRGGGLPFGVKIQEQDGYWTEFIANYAFFFIVMLIVLNMINGIIVDTFQDIREQNNAINEERVNACFICSLHRSKFEIKGIDFEYHTSQEHNIDNYFRYLLKILKTDEHDLNSIDFQVLNAFKQNKIEFFPIKKAKSLESGN